MRSPTVDELFDSRDAAVESALELADELEALLDSVLGPEVFSPQHGYVTGKDPIPASYVRRLRDLVADVRGRCQ